MSINVIRASFTCDGCGKPFKVDMDPADKVNPAIFPTLYDEAVDYVRGGTTSDGEFCSVQDGMHLCGECTSVADQIGDEDHVPTRDEINAALDRPLPSREA